MTDLTAILDRILTWLQNNEPDYASSLQDGLTRAEIDLAARNLPFRLPEEIYEIYQWKNGSPLCLDTNISVPNFGPLFFPIDDAVKRADWCSDDPDDGGIRYKDKMLFPFMGEKYSIAVVIDSDAEYAPVVLADHENGEAMLISLGVNRLFRCALESFESVPPHLSEFKEIATIVSEIQRRHDPEIVDEALRIVLETELQQLENKHYRSMFNDACDTLCYFKDSRAIEPLMLLSNNPAIDRFNFGIIGRYISRISQ